MKKNLILLLLLIFNTIGPRSLQGQIIGSTHTVCSDLYIIGTSIPGNDDTASGF